MAIYAGAVVRVTTTPPFTNAAGALADPTTVNLKWRRHGEADTTWTWTSGTPGPNIVRDSLGVFHADIQTVEPGLHLGRWEGVGAVIAVVEFDFSVESYFVAGVP